MLDIIRERIQDSIDIKIVLTKDNHLLNIINDFAEEIAVCIKQGRKLILCGNGGSASDALHFAGEMVGRFQKERPAWPVVVLNSDVATMTAIANDYGYDNVFSRQAQGHVDSKDVFIGISTSGNSENIYRAVSVAKGKGAVTAAFLGNDGGKIAAQVDYPIIIPSTTTARIQECHILLIHVLCEIVELKLT